MPDNTNPPKKRGCFFYGCLTLALIVGLGGLGVYFAARYVVSKVGKLAEQYTETTPALLERTEIPQAELSALQARVKVFGDALQQQIGTQQLVLTAREINALIGNDANFKALKDKIVVMIDGDRIKGKISWPLPDIGPLKLNGRYLNGEAAFKVSLAGGQLSVTLDDVQVKGVPLPAAILSPLKQQNLARDVQNDPKNQEALEKFDAIQITNSTVILRNKPKE